MALVSWRGRRVLITSGPTREYLDPIRFLSNASSGRMGFALARQARRRGAAVTVVSGPCPARLPAGVRVILVVSALEMRRRVLALCGRSDVVIAAAAVSDYRLRSPAAHKLRRWSRPLRLTLIPNPDIIKEVGLRRRPGQVLAGFALESRPGLSAARRKMRDKGLDLIVANGPSSLGANRSRAVLLRRDGVVRALPALSKDALAGRILEEIRSLS